MGAPAAGTVTGPRSPGAVTGVPGIRRPLPPRPASSPSTAIGPNATLVAREDISPTIVSLRIRPDAGVPAFEPGQYFALGVEARHPIAEGPEASGGAEAGGTEAGGTEAGGAEAGRVLVQRPYSTASPRGEVEALEFLVRLVPGGALTPRLWRLQPGARLRIGRPKGRFRADASDPRRPVFIATGTGIAPLVSMLESRLLEQADGPVGGRPVVLHGAAVTRDLAWRARLEAHARHGRIAYVPAVSRPADRANARWFGAVGRLDGLVPHVLSVRGVDPDDAVAYVCGNPAMIDATIAALRAFSLPADAIRTEAYWVPAPAGASGASG
jgi:ferredoxin/flavodoxin---NADP+ reductase